MKLFQHPRSSSERLIEVDWRPESHTWTVWARTSEAADWDSFGGAEDELASLLAVAHDYVTGG